MPLLFSYLVKLSISLAIVFLFYQFVLRRLTFYNWNRFYLLLYTALSFLIPFIDISGVFQGNQWSEVRVVQWVPVINNFSFAITDEKNTITINYWFIGGIFIISGMAIMLFRLVSQLISFKRMIKRGELISDKEMKIYQVDESIIPFSFGNSIFINRHLHTESELQEIIRHEFVHVKQRHSFDIIWGEILCIINWYNPFVWLLKKSIRQNLEFIADNNVLKNGVNKKQYQYLLLKVIGNNQYSITNQFNFSSLKKRIVMMNKIKSAGVHIVKFLFMLPLIAVSLVAFRNKSKEFAQLKKEQVVNVQDAGIQTFVMKKIYSSDTIPSSSTAANEKNLNNISSEFEITDKEATMKLKNGTIEKYDLTDSLERQKFEKKYGTIIEVNTDSNRVTPVAVITDEGIKTIYVTPSVVTENSSKVIAVSPKAYSSSSQIIEVTPSVSSNVNSNVVTTISPSVVISATTVNGTTVVAPVAVIDDYGYTITGNEDALVTITRNTAKQELEEFKNKMKEKGIELNFGEVKYSDKGILTHISGTMKAKDGNSNFSATDFEKVFLGSIKKGNKTYFKVTVQDKRKVVI